MNADDTIAHYERIAASYAELIDPVPPPRRASHLTRLAGALPEGGTVLEIGSGTGRDADHLEALGFSVRRTDATRAFITMQQQRGKTVDLLDVTRDDLAGPYDGVLALCVLMHVDPALLDRALQRVYAALRPSGAFLVSVRDGRGRTDGPAAMAFWPRDAFAQRLAHAGLHVTFDDRHVDTDDEAWLTFLALRH